MTDEIKFFVSSLHTKIELVKDNSNSLTKALQQVMANHDQGYEENRFEKDVDRNLHCTVCMNVLKDPVQCRRNQHYFCLPCISRHLRQNSPTCLLCVEELTIETLSQPPRILTDLLSSLKIQCDYADGGCRELIELGSLKGHLIHCGYSPTQCGNEGCLETLNKRDKEAHESQLCEFRVEYCDNCGKQELHKNYGTHGCVLRKAIDEVKKNLAEMKINLKDQLDIMKSEIKFSQDRIIEEVRQMTVEVKGEMKGMTKRAIEGLQTDQEHGRMRDEAKKMIAEVKGEVECIKDVIQCNHRFKTRGDIVVAGGRDGLSRLNSVETFSWAKRIWTPLEPMKQKRSVASSFVYENEVFVAGGFTGDNFLNTVERMNMYPPPERWLEGPAKLPFKSRGHKNVVYQHCLIVIGGYNSDTKKVIDGVYEVPLSTPCSSKLLSRMPQSRCYHGSEILGDKILILGGLNGRSNTNSVDSVVLFDLTKKVWKHMTPLPLALYGMATVRWEDSVVLIGGADKNGNSLNTVFIYDVETGRSKMLPTMRYCRVGCAAVVTGNVIVVMGGYNDEQRYLNSVEYFNLDRYLWEELPPMIQNKSYPVAVVKPVV